MADVIFRRLGPDVTIGGVGMAKCGEMVRITEEKAKELLQGDMSGWQIIQGQEILGVERPKIVSVRRSAFVGSEVPEQAGPKDEGAGVS